MLILEVAATVWMADYVVGRVERWLSARGWQEHVDERVGTC